MVSIGQKAKEASKITGRLKTDQKNSVIKQAAIWLSDKRASILAANESDVVEAAKNGMKGAMLDRLTLTNARLEAMVDGLMQLSMLKDPVGEYLSMTTRPNGLIVGCKRVPMGVIAFIFESRPNVAADGFGLCFKAGNAVILRGGKEAIRTNTAVVDVFHEVLSSHNLPEDSVQLVADTSRQSAVDLMKLHKYVDLLIPRGGSGLIQTVVENSTVPVIETGLGNCHVFVDETANVNKAVDIIINAKTQRPSVCNSCETVLVHKSIVGELLPALCRELKEKDVEIRGDETVCRFTNATKATEEDWATEYLDNILAIKVVTNLDEALGHIQRYSTGHSEAIVTENYSHSQRFLDEVDAAAVYVNASTRFTDGFEFGFGAEIGISTQKLHARGPMGLEALTSTKYVILGDGQIRA